MTSRSPRGAAHPGNGVIAPFHGERPRNRGVKDTHRPPFSAPSSRRRPSETAIRTASPALTLKSSRPGTTNRSRLRNGVGRYEPDRRGPDPGRPGPACAMRAQRDAVHLTSRRASPARHNPPELDSREPTWRNASPGDITKTTPPGAGDSRTARRVPGRTRLPRGGARGGRRADGQHDRTRPRTAVSGEKGLTESAARTPNDWETGGRTPNDCSSGHCRGVGITLSFRPRDAYCRRLSNRTRGLRSQKLRPPRRARRTRAPERRSRR